MFGFLVGIFKLLLATSAFALIGWLGVRDKRIGGVLLTFPLLNGIAMLTGVDPLGIAGTVYLVVMWNCVVFLVAMFRYEALPPLPAGLSDETKIVLRVVVWCLAWAAGAAILAFFRDALSFAGRLFSIELCFAGLYVWRCWRRPAAPSSQAFAAMWLNGRGVVRIACFVAAFALLSLVAYVANDSRWVGWASALPLPGLFALATLTVMRDRRDLVTLGDTVLFGPLLVIPFNWLLARAIVALRLADAGTFAEIGTVVAFWAIAAWLVFAVVPRFGRWRDRLGGAA